MRSLSELPGDIIQHIVSLTRLTEREAIQLSVLCKDFFSGVRSRRALAINHPVKTKGCIEELVSLRKTLTRYNLENIKLETFEFRVKYHESHLPSELINLPTECIDLATKLSPSHLDLDLYGWIRHADPPLESVVPQTVFEVESVVQLCLRFCVLKPAGLIKWPNLRRLRLEYFTDEYYRKDTWALIDNLTRSSPLLETLETAGIPCFSYGVNPEPCCPNLRSLSLVGREWFWGDFFINFGKKYARLEHLSIDLRGMKGFFLQSESLKKLELLNIRDCLKEVSFTVPNVVCNGFGIVQAISGGIKIEGDPDMDARRPCKRCRPCLQMPEPDRFPELMLEVHEASGFFTLKRLENFKSAST